MLARILNRTSLLQASPMRLLCPATRMFSSYFQELDKQSMDKMKWAFYKVPEYAKLDDGWRVPLAKKKAKRAQQKAREAEMGPPEAQDPMLYVHNAEKGVTIPAHPE